MEVIYPKEAAITWFWIKLCLNLSTTDNLAGIELMHMIRKGQMKAAGKARPAQQFYVLAG